MPPTLRLNTVLVADDGPRYVVERRLGGGGFGTTYVGNRISKSGRKMAFGKVCIKVCSSRTIEGLGRPVWRCRMSSELTGCRFNALSSSIARTTDCTGGKDGTWVWTPGIAAESSGVSL